MKAINFVIVHNTESHNWKSCEELEESLYSAYKAICAGRAKFIDLVNGQVGNLPTNSTIIIITHKITTAFIKTLENHSKESSILWHVFGNFANLFIMEPRLSGLMKNFNVQLISASYAHANRVQHYLEDTKSYKVFALPFGADEKIFKNFRNVEKITTRKKYSLKENDFLICYAGRLSFQKNIFLLIKIFVEIAANDKKAHLMLCGNFDDLGFAEIGLRLGSNAYQAKIMSYVDSVPAEIKKRIHFSGNLDKSELSSVLSASDLLISLSTYILEDFGLSPVQALLSGTPVVLTDWGGYRDLKINLDGGVDLIKLTSRKDEIFIDRKNIIKIINERSFNKLNFEQKTELSKRARSIYSNKALESRIEILIQEKVTLKFPGLNFKTIDEFKPEVNKLHFKIKFSSAVVNQMKSYLANPDDEALFDENNYSITQDWNNLLLSLYAQNLKVTPLERNELAEHWPAFREYNDSYPSLYAFQIDSLEKLQNHGHVLLRDGIDGVSAFFKIYPCPNKKSKTKIGINLKLRNKVLIPRNWLSNIVWYNYEIKNNFKKNKPTDFLLVMNNPAQSSEKIISKYLIKKYKIFYYVNGENFLNEKEEAVLLNTKFKYIKWGNFLNQQNFSEITFEDYGDLNLSAKNFTEDYLIDHGANVLIKTLNRSNLLKLEEKMASPFRKIVIYYEKG